MRGMGVYSARALAAELEGLAAELRGQGRRAIAALVDITQPEGQGALLTAAEHAFGAVAILVNNAGLDFWARQRHIPRGGREAEGVGIHGAPGADGCGPGMAGGCQ